MSSLITRMIFTVALGIVGAVAAYVFSTACTVGTNSAHVVIGAAGRRRRRPPVTDDSSLNQSNWEVIDSDGEEFEDLSQGAWIEEVDDDEEDNTVIHDDTISAGNTPSLRSTEDKQDILKSCEICMEKFVDIKRRKGEIYTTPCGHLYCKVCLIESLSLKPNCPACRTPVDPHQTHRIFL